jgi:hypothetical protein
MGLYSGAGALLSGQGGGVGSDVGGRAAAPDTGPRAVSGNSWKIEGGAELELVITVEDPVTLEHPYSYRRIYHWRPDVRPQEYICEENNRNAPVNGVTVAK